MQSATTSSLSTQRCSSLNGSGLSRNSNLHQRPLWLPGWPGHLPGKGGQTDVGVDGGVGVPAVVLKCSGLTSSGMGLQTQLAACCILHAVHRQWSYAEHLNLGDLSLQFSVSQVSVQHTYETKQSVSIWSFMIALNYLRLKSIYCKGYLDLWKLLKNKRNFVLLKSINLTFLITNVRVTV